MEPARDKQRMNLQTGTVVVTAGFQGSGKAPHLQLTRNLVSCDKDGRPDYKRQKQSRLANAIRIKAVDARRQLLQQRQAENAGLLPLYTALDLLSSSFSESVCVVEPVRSRSIASARRSPDHASRLFSAICTFIM